MKFDTNNPCYKAEDLPKNIPNFNYISNVRWHVTSVCNRFKIPVPSFLLIEDDKLLIEWKEFERNKITYYPTIDIDLETKNGYIHIFINNESVEKYYKFNYRSQRNWKKFFRMIGCIIRFRYSEGYYC